MTHIELDSRISTVKAGATTAWLSDIPPTVVLTPERRERILRLVALPEALHDEVYVAVLESGVSAIRDGRLQIGWPGSPQELIPTILDSWVEAFADGRLDLALVVTPVDRNGESGLRFIPREMKPALLVDLLDGGVGGFDEALLEPRSPRRRGATQARSHRPLSFKARARRAAARRRRWPR